MSFLAGLNLTKTGMGSHGLLSPLRVGWVMSPPNEHRKKMPLDEGRVIAYCGERGEGKSANMVKDGIDHARKLKKKIFANFPIFSHRGPWRTHHGKKRIEIPLCSNGDTEHEWLPGKPEDWIYPQCKICGAKLINFLIG